MKDIMRNAFPEVHKAILRSPVVGLLGPRQSGKTTLARQLAKKFKNTLVLDLELPSDLQKLQNAELFLSEYSDQLVILDEIQRLPELFPMLRALVDQNRKPGRFLLLGSADRQFLKQSSESLAGRIEYFELPPFLVSEVGYENLDKHWLRGGFPLSFGATSLENSFVWRRSFLNTYIERDLIQLGLNADPRLIYRLLQMIAHQNGSIWNASTISGSLGVSQPTVQRYLDFLDGSFLIHRLPPYFANSKKRLVKAPKIYFRDSGLLHCIWEKMSRKELMAHPSVGASFEGWVVSQLRSELQGKYDFYFYRTHAGTECDLILTKAGIPKFAIEIKYSLSLSITPSMRNTMEDLNLKKLFIVVPTSDNGYPLSVNVRVLNLRELLGVVAK